MNSFVIKNKYSQGRGPKETRHQRLRLYQRPHQWQAAVKMQIHWKNKELVEGEEAMAMDHIRQEEARGKTFDFRGWLAMGIYYAKTGHNQEAIKAFLKCVSLDPYQTDAWFNLGSLYEAGKNWTGALTAYQKLLGLPDLTEFQREFASSHLSALEGH